MAKLKEQIAQWHVCERIFLPLLTQMERFLGAQTPAEMRFAGPQVHEGCADLSVQDGRAELHVWRKLAFQMSFFHSFPFSLPPDPMIFSKGMW